MCVKGFKIREFVLKSDAKVTIFSQKFNKMVKYCKILFRKLKFQM